MNMEFDFAHVERAEIQLKPVPLTVAEQEIHSRGIARAGKYREAEAALLETIMEVEDSGLYFKLETTSLFAYCLKFLNLTEPVTCNFIAVARKAKQVPALKAAIDDGSLGISKARKIVSVLTPENQREWIESATTLTQAKLERKVAEASPETASREPERARAKKNRRVDLQIDVSDILMQKIRRAQDLVSESHQGFAGLEETLDALADLYLEKKDPLHKAERRARKEKMKFLSSKGPEGDAKSEVTSNNDRKIASNTTFESSYEGRAPATDTKMKTGVDPDSTEELATNRSYDRFISKSKKRDQRSTWPASDWRSKRKALPSAVKQAIDLRDRRRCRAKLPGGRECGTTRFLHYHHVISVSRGGSDTVENLITLCGNCHHRWHDQEKRP